MEKPQLTLWQSLTHVAWVMGDTPGMDILGYGLEKGGLTSMKESVRSSLHMKPAMLIHSLICSCVTVSAIRTSGSQTCWSCSLPQPAFSARTVHAHDISWCSTTWTCSLYSSLSPIISASCSLSSPCGKPVSSRFLFSTFQLPHEHGLPSGRSWSSIY